MYHFRVGRASLLDYAYPGNDSCHLYVVTAVYDPKEKKTYTVITLVFIGFVIIPPY